ncbi:MAG: TolC family protein [Elusimicrobiota bacterium]
MKKVVKFLLIIFFVITGTAGAESNPRQIQLTVDEAVGLAIDNSEEILKTRLNEKRQKRKYKETKASIFPQVKGSFNWSRYIESPVLDMDLGPMGSREISLNEDWEMRFGLTASQVIFAFGKITNAIELAEKSMEMQKFTRKLSKNEISYATKRIFYSLLFAKDSLKIAEESYDNVLQNKEALKTKFKGGRISRTNNIKMEADVASRQPRILDLEERIAKLTVQFKDLLNLDDEENIVLKEKFTEDFPEFTFSELRDAMIHNSPSLNMSVMKLKLKETNKNLKKAQYFPTISGFLNYSFSGESSEPVVKEEYLNREVIAGLKLNYNFWEGGARRNALKGSEIDKDISEVDYRKKVNEMEVSLKSALKSYRKLIETYNTKKEVQRLSEESYQAMLSSFKSGLVSQTALNDAERQLTGAKIDALSTLYQINLTLAQIEKLTVRSLN